MDYLIHHMLRASARKFPGKEALVHRDRRLTFQELAEKVSGFSEGIVAAGLSRGERVAILLDPSVEQVVSIFGVSQAQGVFVPVHHSLKPDQVAHIANDCEISALVTSADRLIDLLEVIESIPSLKFVVVLDAQDAPPTVVPTLDFLSLVEVEHPKRSIDLAVEKDLGAILYTSGSTGKPKGVMLSHANVVAGASIVSDYLSISETDRILAVLPFSFDAGLNQLTTAIQQGSTLVLTNFRFAREIVTNLEKEEITALAGVPPLWNLLAQPSSTLASTQLPHLRYITNTGGAMPQKTLKALRNALPETQVFLMYGLTEAFRSTYLPPEELDHRPASMGKAIPNSEILVVNSEGKQCGPGEVGELVHHGPTVSLGYWGHHELTDRVLRPHPFPLSGMNDGVKVCYSGDLVRMDEEGFLYFVGRRDNLIKSSGFRVSPTEVEELISQSGKVREAAVIGIPDEMLGQHIKAFVVLEDGATLTEDELLGSSAELMPKHMVPKSIVFLDSLPKTSSGKVNYPALRLSEENSETITSSQKNISSH